MTIAFFEFGENDKKLLVSEDTTKSLINII